MIPPEVLLEAYRMGVFPMAMDGGEIGWFSPDPRGIIPVDDDFHIPHGLKRALRKEPYEVRIDTDFEGVMEGCADRVETWINDEILDSYCQLHQMGHAHSVECWKDDKLMGGLYGISIQGAFFGESMFSRATDASKIALVALVERMRSCGMVLLDTQWSTDHLKTFGCRELPRVEYLELLTDAVDLEVSFETPKKS